EARETSRTITETKSKQSGFTVAFTSPVITAVQTAQQMSEAAKDTKDGRMKALAAASTGLAGYNAYTALEAGQGKTVALADGTVKDNQIPVLNDKGDVTDYRDATAADKMGGVGINLSIGGSKISSTTTQTSDTAAVSNLAAGRDIRIEASGAGSESDILLQGTKATAARNLTLTAEDEIRLLATRNTADQHSTDKNSSASVGIGFMVGGTQNGFTIQAGVSGGKAKADGQDVSHSNTHVEAGQTLTLESGGNTTMKGAVAKGEKVVADIGKDLLIESLQDTSTYDSQQKSLGVSVSLCIPPFCVGAPSTGSVSASNSKVESDYASVTEQSAIRAGDKGFDVDVKGDTDLKGGAITGTQKAIDDQRNQFKTGGELSLSDIENKAEYKAKSASVNVGTGFSAAGALTPGGTSAGFGNDGDKAESMTLAAISGVAGNKDARTGDKETGIGKIFDQEKVQKEIDAQVKITQMFNQLAPKAVGEYAKQRENELRLLANQAEGAERDRLLQEANKWAEGGVNRVLMHTVVGGLGGGTGGALGAGASSTITPLLAEQIVKLDLPFDLKMALIQAAGTAVGGLAGGAAGAAAGLNETANNFGAMLRAGQLAAQAARLGVDKLSAAEAAMLQSCVNNSACRELVSSVLPASAMAWFISQNMTTPSSSLVDQIPGGYAAGDRPQPVGPLVTPMPDPKKMQELYGTPPLQNPDQLRSWLANALEGYPADEAEKWARGLITTLPAAQQSTWQDFILQAVQDNAIAGSRREREVTIDLQTKYPGGSVQNQQYLRDRDGNIVIDPSTGTARRLDHVVVVGGKIVDVVETTSLTAEKDKQIEHERETRKAGGVYIRDRNTGNLIEVPSISRIERRS
ncbi:MAG: Filamentous hemagglutinin N-terminal protein, partial [Pseudomonadota bacterium]|nr:Filamentous hemagglutinin N-terminal protein [Pseudomonadota bacterium]